MLKNIPGNELYKKKQFSEALEMYDKAAFHLRKRSPSKHARNRYTLWILNDPHGTMPYYILLLLLPGSFAVLLNFCPLPVGPSHSLLGIWIIFTRRAPSHCEVGRVGRPLLWCLMTSLTTTISLQLRTALLDLRLSRNM